jgi:hypothetical protein
MDVATQCGHAVKSGEQIGEARVSSDQAEPFNVKRAALAATVGNMLEFYDFITYSFFAIQIGHTFFVVPITAYLIEIAQSSIGRWWWRSSRRSAGAGLVPAACCDRRTCRDEPDAGDCAGEAAQSRDLKGPALAGW